MMIAFATQPGNVALDGEGRNSPYTSALLKHIGAQGQSINDVMIEVRRDVL
ncbi:MAG: caspase family protein [Hyphomicrobiales bacterium]